MPYYKEGNKSDKVDARKLADLLRTGMLRPVYHGENGLRTLGELGRSYQTISQDLNRVMNRLKALYRGWGIACAGTQVYAPRYREEWLQKIEHAGVHRTPGDPRFSCLAVAHRFYDARVRGRVSMHSLGVRVLSCSTESPGQSYAPSDNPTKP
jgi:transposase